METHDYSLIITVLFIFLLSCFVLGVIILKELNENLCKLVKILGIRRPGPVRIKTWQGENGMLKFVLVLPEKGVSDVVKRHLSVAVGGGEPMVVELGADVVASDVLEGVDNDIVTGSLVDEDDAGNKSEAREFSFVLVDDIAPPQPGELGIKVLSEE